MIDGFYAIYYTGKSSSGLGVLVFKDGIIAGADAAGIFYDGEYTINQDKEILEGTIKMTIPPGVSLVTGAPVSQHAYALEFPVSLPLDLSQQEPLRIELPTGPVNVNELVASFVNRSNLLKSWEKTDTYAVSTSGAHEPKNIAITRIPAHALPRSRTHCSDRTALV
jgi:hypothetical protein